MPKPCPISGVGHYWKLEPYERYIFRGQCDCGAVKYFSDGLDKENIARAELLNKKKEKAGKEPSKQLAIALATRAEQSSDNTVNIKEKVAQNVDNLGIKPRPESRRHMPLGRPRIGKYFNCVDCGKEIYVRKYRLDKEPEAEHRCRRCANKHYKRPAGTVRIPTEQKKEGTMAEIRGVGEEGVVPPKPTNRKQVRAYFEENKEAILADYRSMKILKFFKRWAITPTSWQKLKKQWEVQGKREDASARPADRSSEKEPEGRQPRPGEFCILITEEDLAKLDDEQFRQQWLLFGRILQNRLADKS